MIRVAIVDDERHHRQVIENSIKSMEDEIGEKISISEFDSGEKLLDSLSKGYHIIFFDQMMPPGISGFDTAKQIRKTDKSVVIIFVTAIEELWEDGYSVQAFYYLTKPIEKDKFGRVFKRAVAKVMEERSPVTIQTMGGMYVFDIRDILYLKKNQRYTDLYFFDRETGDIVVEKLRTPIKTAESRFAAYDFVRPHISYLVNPIHIRRIIEENRDKCLELVTGEKIFISRDRVKSVYEVFMKSLEKRTFLVP